ncbi:MAG: multicopper oxidase domain-containing protein [Desulfobulbaceae bacterium]|nr:multicopper oxidase domain-containing protein [Desulfobulbaceae bacterium]
MKRAIPSIKKKAPVLLLLAWLLLPVSSFAVNLAAVPAQWTPPDSPTAITMWGFIPDPGSCPSGPVAWDVGPLQIGSPGENLTITLRNCLSEPVSLVIPGQSATLTPQVIVDDQGRTRVTAFTHEAGPGGTASYTWNNLKAGTYLYQSGSHPAKQVQMGLYGALTVGEYPGTNKEILLLYSEIDPALHIAADPATPMTYKPRYFLINGKSFAPGQPVPDIPAGNSGDTLLIRFVNAGLMSHAPVLPGPYMRVVAEDGNPYPYPREQYSLLLAAGKTKDVVWTPDMPGKYALHDRALALSSNGEAGGGMLVHLNVKFPWMMFVPAITGGKVLN